MNQWIRKFVRHWTNEARKERTNEPTNQWINESGNNQWINESMNQLNQWTNESLNPCPNEWMNEWMNERTNKWTNERTNERTNEWKNDLLDGWIDVGMGELLFFVEILLVWAATYLTYLSYFCSELPPSCHFCSFCSAFLFFKPVQRVLQRNVRPAAIRRSTRVGLWWKTTFRAAVRMRWATSSCNPAYQERRNITDTLLPQPCQ